MTSPSNLPPEVSISERDATYLRQAIEWSNTARVRGNRPFGAVVVDQSGHVLTQAYNCGTENTISPPMPRPPRCVNSA